ncbi:hypothetical protein P7K49_020891 [Saguinus oedipus]|uniref:SRCR domain-containing protein n=1 Tax=Saguinus oedipus TaxID=9490 RepID=A0ABQ9UR31_SAGOE|nr:hypothetical protein P7K49_020891 [Saguinus oedipus]
MSHPRGAGRDPTVCFFSPVHFWRGHTGIRYKEQRESCPKHAVRCDGVVDCKLKSDELGCVRFDWDKSLLQIYSESSHQWLPICSSNWNDSYSEKTCQQLGFQSAYRTTEVAHRDFANSFSISRYNSTIQESLHRNCCGVADKGAKPTHGRVVPFRTGLPEPVLALAAWQRHPDQELGKNPGRSRVHGTSISFPQTVD